jgi:aspartyl/asparaginyl beta-hydroxylase
VLVKITDAGYKQIMLDLSAQPFIDKHAIVGGCVRLPVAVDVEIIRAEVSALSPGLWGTTGGRVGVHSAAEALFLRGYAPAEGNRPIQDRPALNRLPYIRSILQHVIPASPLRALLARLPAGATISPHVDQGSYFHKSLRLHVPIETNDQVWMLCNGQTYQMRPGEIWALNNVSQHAVWNDHPFLSRTHLICDFLPADELVSLVYRGDRDLGQPVRRSDAKRLSAQ